MIWLEPAILFCFVFKASQSTYTKQSTPQPLHVPLSLFCWRTLAITKPVFPLPLYSAQSTIYENLGNFDTASSKGLRPPVCRSTSVLRCRQTDWGGSKVPLRENTAIPLQIYTHSLVLPLKWPSAIYLEKRKFSEILSVFRYQIWPGTQKPTVQHDSVIKVIRKQEVKSRPESLWCWVCWVHGSTLWLFTPFLNA